MLQAWEHVFEITGPAGVQLIGLMFVVVTLGELSGSRSVPAVRGFVTPTLVHFSSVLLQSIAALSPWPSDASAGIALALIGLVGVGYSLRAVAFKKRAGVAKLSGVNWFAYNGAPLLANVVLVCGGVGLTVASPLAPFAVAAASTLLLAAGIYGAWDVTLWVLKSRKS
jgi:hypothetical protein